MTRIWSKMVNGIITSYDVSQQTNESCQWGERHTMHSPFGLMFRAPLNRLVERERREKEDRKSITEFSDRRTNLSFLIWILNKGDSEIESELCLFFYSFVFSSFSYAFFSCDCILSVFCFNLMISNRRGAHVFRPFSPLHWFRSKLSHHTRIERSNWQQPTANIQIIFFSSHVITTDRYPSNFLFLSRCRI